MSSGADLFVVCRQCGSEVSPYITECPYCGHRLRRRAPKLPRASRSHSGDTASRRSRIPTPSLGRLRRGEIAGIRGDFPPFASFGLVGLSCAVWIATSAGFVSLGRLLVIGPLDGEWWRLFTSQFAYSSRFASEVYLFAVLLSVAVFGWLVERRHGPFVVAALFLGSGVGGGLLAEVFYPLPILSGGLAGALALVACWAVPDLESLRRGEYYDGDLLGAGAFAVVLLAMPAALPEASWLACLTGGLCGLGVGFGLGRVRAA
jgi:hypothetical protein